MEKEFNLDISGTKHAIRITLIYFFISVAWIFFSDRLLETVISDGQNLMKMQTYKGWFFVFITSILLFYLIKRSTSSIIKSKDETEKALQENQQLLSELHHRVKHNLALISSLVELQVSNLDTQETTALLKTQFRIFALAEIQELFYQNKDISRVPFHKYINQFTVKLEETETNNISFTVQAEELFLDIDQAIRLGLLFNEIFTPLRIVGSKGQDQEVDVDLAAKTPNNVLLEITFDDTASSLLQPLKQEEYIEQTLMELYAKQLDSSIKWLQENGSVIFRLVFKSS